MFCKKLFLTLSCLFCACLWSCVKENDNVVVTTCPITEITYDAATDLSSAELRGEVSGGSDIYERGFIWSKTNKFDFVKTPLPDQTGEFVYELTGLEKNVRYYVTAYALSTSRGVTYGECLYFIASTVPVFEKPAVGTDITGTGFTACGSVISGGAEITEYGVYVKTAGDAESTKILSDNLNGTEYSVVIQGLLPETEYEVILFASNANGETRSEAVTVKTGIVSLPEVEKPVISSIFPTMMNISCRLINDGNDPALTYGIRWGYSENDMSNTVECTGLTDDGSYSATVSGLTPGSGNVYVSSFAVNAAGERVSEAVSEAVPDLSAPEVATSVPVKNTDIFDNSITLRGRIVSNGGLDLDSYGFDLTLTESESVVGSFPADNLDDEGNFSVTLTEADGITANTEYTISAYAVNSEGKSAERSVSARTGLADLREGAELYVRDAAMQFTSVRLVYWELEPLTLTVGASSKTLVFLDRNLGATAIPASFNSNQRQHPEAVGSYFQWGQTELSPRISAAKAQGGYDAKVSVTQNSYQVNTLTNSDTWSALAETGVISNPCPEGYRPVTADELTAAVAAKGVDWFGFSATGFFASGGAYDTKNDSQSLCYLWTDQAAAKTNSRLASISATGTVKITDGGRKQHVPIRCVREVK